MDQRRLRAVLWDFDGAVVDSELMWIEYEKDELARHGASWSDEQLKDRIGEPAIVTAQRISESCSGAITLAQAYEPKLSPPWGRLSWPYHCGTAPERDLGGCCAKAAWKAWMSNAWKKIWRSQW